MGDIHLYLWQFNDLVRVKGFEPPAGKIAVSTTTLRGGNLYGARRL
jgi:hypothetical protein